MPNKYIRKFKSLKISELIANEPAFSKLNSHPNKNKEITEAMAIAKEARKLIYRIKSLGGDVQTIVDVGCGTGFLTVIMASLYPEMKVIAIDNNEKLNTAALEYFSNVEFVKADIHSKRVGSVLKKAGGSIMLGSHLCKDLAERFVELYNKTYNVLGCVLMPCCIGSIPVGIQNTYSILNSLLGREKSLYVIWCMYLKSLMWYQSKCRIDRDVLSPKNILLISHKQP